MRSRIVSVVLILALASVCWGAELPSAPKSVEHDPGAWAATTAFTSELTGTFVKPKYGLMAGVAFAVLGNMQNSNNAHQDMVGGIGGAVAGYLIIKTLRGDWHKSDRKRSSRP